MIMKIFKKNRIIAMAVLAAFTISSIGCSNNQEKEVDNSTVTTTELTTLTTQASESTTEVTTTTNETVEDIPLTINTLQTEFNPGQIWYDTDGNPIDAHGMGIMWDEYSQKWYWYGEHHANTYPASGVGCYSSTDLINWTNEGMALRTIPSMESLKEDGSYFKELYNLDNSMSDDEISNLWQGTPGVLANAGIRTGRIPERPKVVYNEATKKYVMWVHIEGHSDASGNPQTGYGRAEAGVALSDSPTGPFRWISSFRMDECPNLPGHVDSNPNSKGYARDMNLYVDDDGTAYLIYSSEENRTMYISKLLPDYTDVAGWHKDDTTLDDLEYVSKTGRARPRDEEYKSVYGEDYIRLWQGLQHEAPAIFKYDGLYYLITSGATGWSPNPGMYDTAPSMLGPWTATSENPFTGASTGSNNGTPSNSFNSQSSCVIPVDPANGKFIYCGDRWNGGNFANHAATYVFLPIEFTGETEIAIRWMDSFNLDDLENKQKINMLTDFPDIVSTGEVPDLPDTIEIQPVGAANTTVNVEWQTKKGTAPTADDFTTIGTVTLQAKLLSDTYNNRLLDVSFTVIPENAVYFINAGGYETSDYLVYTEYMDKDGTLKNKGTPDQAYKDGVNWGYIGTSKGEVINRGDNGTGINGSATGTIQNTIRWLDNQNVTGTEIDLSYIFDDVSDGIYDVYMGFYDPWNNDTRSAAILINGEDKGSFSYTGVNNKVYKDIEIANNSGLNIVVRNNSNSGQDPMVSWIVIALK